MFGNRLLIILTLSFSAGFSVNCPGSDTIFQQKDESIMEEAVVEATRLSQGNKRVSELLARLIQKDAELIFSVKKLGLRQKQLMDLFQTDCHCDLDQFATRITLEEQKRLL